MPSLIACATPTLCSWSHLVRPSSPLPYPHFPTPSPGLKPLTTQKSALHWLFICLDTGRCVVRRLDSLPLPRPPPHSLKKNTSGQAWWHRPLMPELLGRGRLVLQGWPDQQGYTEKESMPLYPMTFGECALCLKDPQPLCSTQHTPSTPQCALGHPGSFKVPGCCQVSP